ncbi:transmembrane protein 272-like [Erpetoichthys calabaricus]|uniref:Uncharacterized protein n=1 Tax=Erpetoichthys calabaricus TaxID=27687 RepID=A0A8C4RNZ8_ERPCA|nr:transmembrane protein 272-like [Erpetoichthys calabaricus]
MGDENNSSLKIRIQKRISENCVPVLKGFFNTLVIGLSTAEIVVGAVYLEDCPVQRYIPLYLIVMGVAVMITRLFTSFKCCEQKSRLCQVWKGVLFSFLLMWFISGNVWIYKTKLQVLDKEKPDYCNKSLYLFAFWMTTLLYTFLGLMLVTACCTLGCIYALYDEKSTQVHKAQEQPQSVELAGSQV